MQGIAINEICCPGCGADYEKITAKQMLGFFPQKADATYPEQGLKAVHVYESRFPREGHIIKGEMHCLKCGNDWTIGETKGDKKG